jgi:hypothetical protein
VAVQQQTITTLTLPRWIVLLLPNDTKGTAAAHVQDATTGSPAKKDIFYADGVYKRGSVKKHW